MKRFILALILLFLTVHFPWRIAALVVEAEFMSPGPLRLSTDTDAYWRALQLEARLEGMGWAVGYVKGINYNGVAAYGLTDSRSHAIFIDSELSWNNRLAVLAHEGGHTLQPNWLEDREPDVFAEMVAMLVARDGVREHARYLAGMKVDVLIVGIMEWQAAYHAAAVLTDE